MKFGHFPIGKYKGKSAGGGGFLKFGDFPIGEYKGKSAGGGDYSKFGHFPIGKYKAESSGMRIFFVMQLPTKTAVQRLRT